jgi:hypothetical protein
MATTTIRIDRAVHQRLIALSRDSGQQLMDTVRDATEALERARFAASVVSQLDALRLDPDTWDAYVNEAENAVRDGIA